MIKSLKEIQKESKKSKLGYKLQIKRKIYQFNIDFIVVIKSQIGFNSEADD